MILLLDRYIARQFLGTFFGLVLGLPVLFVVADVTDNLDKYLARGLERDAVALSYLYAIPQFVFWAVPIAGLVATVFTIGNMTRHQEITAAKAGGVSFYRLLAPILALSTLLSLGAVALGDVVPVATQRSQELRGERQFNSSTLRMNFVFQAEDGRTLAVRRLDSEADEMHEVVIERGTPRAGRAATHLIARRASWSRNEGWTVMNGQLRVIGAGEAERSFAFDSARIPTLRETPEELLAEPKKPEAMRYAEMSRFVESMERSGGDTRRLRVELHQKLSLPLALLVIVLFGAPLSTSSQRGGAAYGVGVSLAVTMVYLLLFKLAVAIGQSGALPPAAAAWLPNALFLVGGVYLLARART